MKSIFLVWKDKNCNGENSEWIYMKANEFFEFKKLPENADRRFVQVGDKKSSLDDTEIFIEANEELYKKSNPNYTTEHRKGQHLLNEERYEIYVMSDIHGSCIKNRLFKE